MCATIRFAASISSLQKFQVILINKLDSLYNSLLTLDLYYYFWSVSELKRLDDAIIIVGRLILVQILYKF